MGYESKIYVVEKPYRPMIDKDINKGYAEIIATFNMCKMNAFDGIFVQPTDCFVYADDGNTRITEDRYGDSLKEARVDEVIDYLEEFEQNKEFYRRVHPLLSLLNGFDKSEWRNLSVLHYGY